MKKIFYFILLLPIFLSGCEKELMDYEGVEGVYFAVQWGASYANERTWPYQPYTAVQFMQLGDVETTMVEIKVMVTGPLKNYDRTFRVEVNPDSTTAVEQVDYLLLENDIVIKAGEYTAMVPVKLLRTEALQHEEKVLGLKLVENEYFKLAFPEWDAVAGFTSGELHEHFDASLHAIRFSDMMTKPAVWPGTDSSSDYDGAESGQWGAFSLKKLELMCELFNLTYSDFMSTETMPTVLQKLIAQTMCQFLIDRYNAKDPVLEEDGRLMFVGDCPWSSKIGVPWIPDEGYYD